MLYNNLELSIGSVCIIDAILYCWADMVTFSGFTTLGRKEDSFWDIEILVDCVWTNDSCFWIILIWAHRQIAFRLYTGMLSLVPIRWTAQTCQAPGRVCTCPSLTIWISLKGTRLCAIYWVWILLSDKEIACCLALPVPTSEIQTQCSQNHVHSRKRKWRWNTQSRNLISSLAFSDNSKVFS